MVSCATAEEGMALRSYLLLLRLSQELPQMKIEAELGLTTGRPCWQHGADIGVELLA